MRLVDRPIMMIRKAVLFSALLLSATLPAERSLAQNAISFTVTNASFDPIHVILYDDVCHRRLLEGAIGGNATITLKSGPQNRHFGSIRIQNRVTGITCRHSGLMSEARIRLR